MKLTVAICTWNRCDLLRPTLEQMTKLRPPTDATWELLVVNNNCTDATDVVVKSFEGKLPIQLLRESKAGQSHARNCAINAATGDYILWTDDDVLVSEGWLEEYAAAFRAYPDAAVFGGTITPWFDGTPPAWLAAVWHRVANAYAVREFGDQVVPLSDKLVPFGANFAMRLDVQRRFMYNPDLGLKPGSTVRGDETTVIRAALAAGGAGWWIPKASVRHFIPRARQSVRYLRGYFTGQGVQAVRLSPPPESSRGPTFAGRPRWMLRRALELETIYRLHRLTRSAEVWVEDLKACAVQWGKLEGYRELNNSPATATQS